MPSASTLTNGLNYLATFVGVLIAGLIGFDWLTFFTAEQALKIVGGLNLLGLLVKAWITTAEQMAKQMAVK
jgi:hypothetical protein